MIVEVCADSKLSGSVNTNGLSIVCTKMLHFAMFAICSKIAVNLLVEMLLLMEGFKIGI